MFPNNLLAIWWALKQALSKTLATEELQHLKEQFALLEPNKTNTISLENIKAVGFFPALFIHYIKRMMFGIS